jgi:multicomponent Na+:H+ antiporter subunit D
VAAAIAMFATRLPRRAIESVAFATAVATLGVSVVLLHRAGGHRIVYWFSGWHPRHGVAIGISFTIDAVGAGAAVLISFLFCAAFMFSWRYFQEAVQGRYSILMLVFLGAMNGFVLTGDLFDLFVFFELLSVAAYALTAYQIEERGPLQGGLNFAIVNSLGSFGVLLGIALVYARTGALNLAQIGHVLHGHPPTGAIVVGFTLIVVGLLVKAGAVPFQFWLSDAYAVVSPSVGVLFTGIMSELGLFGVVRLYWTAFQGSLGMHQVALGHVLIGLGVLTAVVGAVMCFLQQHLRRLIAFATVGHVGVSLIGVGLLEHVGMAGAVIYVVSSGLIKASLFLLCGILVFRLAMIDEDTLRGRGKALVGTGLMFAVGGIALAEVPPFATFTGKTLIEDAASRAGYHWMPWVFGLTAALTAGAVLRAAAGIFLGWGEGGFRRFGPEQLGEEEIAEEVRRPEDHTPLTMWMPAAVLLAAGFSLGLLPGLSGHVERAAAQFQDRSGYERAVLGNVDVPEPFVRAEGPSSLGAWYGLASGAAAVSLALVSLFRRRIVSSAIRRRVEAAVGPPIKRLRLLHSGHVGDYAAWFVLGLAALGGLFALATR